MSIYATQWVLKFPRFGDAHTGCEWVEVIGQGVPAHIGTPSPGHGYEAGDPYAGFLPPPVPVPAKDDGRTLRAIVIVSEGTKKVVQEYINPLLVLSGQEYAAIPFAELHERICAALRGGRPRWLGEWMSGDGKVRLLVRRRIGSRLGAAGVIAMHVTFSISPPKGDRVYHVSEADIRVVLGRLPRELWHRLRAVHFNDRSRGGRVAGYVNRGRREIALCALPPRISLTRFLLREKVSPREFGAWRGQQWAAVAIRRCLLYDTFLHEVGHLQVINPRAKSERRKFAMEACARAFALRWRRLLWSQPFSHPDPAHHAPGAEELAGPTAE